MAAMGEMSPGKGDGASPTLLEHFSTVDKLLGRRREETWQVPAGAIFKEK